MVANDLSPERTDATAIESESIGGFRASAELGGFYERGRGLTFHARIRRVLVDLPR